MGVIGIKIIIERSKRKLDKGFEDWKIDMKKEISKKEGIGKIKNGKEKKVMGWIE